MVLSDAETVCFHDVDLIPHGDNVADLYLDKCESPLHIGTAFQRYASRHFFGGILMMSRKDVLRVNGFPNRFWGWGGEDDALLDRCKRLEIEIRRPLDVTIKDLEELNIEQKMNALRRADAKCPDKWERRAEDATLWRVDGINSVTRAPPTILERTQYKVGTLSVVHFVLNLNDGCVPNAGTHPETTRQSTSTNSLDGTTQPSRAAKCDGSEATRGASRYRHHSRSGQPSAAGICVAGAKHANGSSQHVGPE